MPDPDAETYELTGCVGMCSGATRCMHAPQYIRELYWRYEYEEVVTPNIYNFDLWKTSGHADHYKDNMFLINIEKQEFGLKPMNCPGALQARCRSPSRAGCMHTALLAPCPSSCETSRCEQAAACGACLVHPFTCEVVQHIVNRLPSTGSRAGRRLKL